MIKEWEARATNIHSTKRSFQQRASNNRTKQQQQQQQTAQLSPYRIHSHCSTISVAYPTIHGNYVGTSVSESSHVSRIQLFTMLTINSVRLQLAIRTVQKNILHMLLGWAGLSNSRALCVLVWRCVNKIRAMSIIILYHLYYNRRFGQFVKLE